MFFLRQIIKSIKTHGLKICLLISYKCLLYHFIDVYMIYQKKFSNQVWGDRVALYLLSSIKTKNTFHRNRMQKIFFYRFLLVCSSDLIISFCKTWLKKIVLLKLFTHSRAKSVLLNFPVVLNPAYYEQVLYIIDFLKEFNFIIPVLSHDCLIIFFFRSLTKEKFSDEK